MPGNPSEKKNLLLISMEDLNDYIEPVGGHPEVKTPNLTRLAARGALFPNTYAAAPACSPARAAVLFGAMPWQSGIYTNKQQWFHAYPPGVRKSLIGEMKSAGYATFGAGKVFYGGVQDDEWDRFFKEPNDPYEGVSTLQKSNKNFAGMYDYGPSERGSPLYDERNAAHIMDCFKPGARGQVWVLGIYRPHLPFIAPQRFFDMYPERVSPAPALKERIFDPFGEEEVKGLPPEAINRIVRGQRFGARLHKVQQYNDFLKAYLASISFADHVLGVVLDALEAAGLSESTYVALWSDHGYQFGEKNVFHKFSLWERSLRTPMIFAGPGIPPRICEHPVSNVDLGPTLRDLLGISSDEPRAGRNLRQVLEKGQDDSPPPVISVFGFPNNRPNAPSNSHLLAWTVRSERYRLIRYWRGGVELYDHSIDPYEHNNLAEGAKEDGIPAELATVVRQLTEQIPKKPAPTVSRQVPYWTKGEDHLPHWAQSIGRK